jgi:peptide/nickel transport system permease protein
LLRSVDSHWQLAWPVRENRAVVTQGRTFVTATSATTLTAGSALSQGQSQWALVWHEFLKRRLAVAAAIVILMLITVSVFAPVLANARPIYYFGFNRFEYQEAARTLRGTLTRLIEARASDTPPDVFDKFHKTIALQIELMADALPADSSARLRTLGEQMLTAAKSTDSAQSIEDLKRLNRETRSAFDAKEVTLVSRANWPVLASLNGIEVGFLVANVLFLLLPVWHWLIQRLLKSDRVLLRRWTVVGIQFGIPLLVAGGWWWSFPARVDRTEYKSGVLAADPQAATAPVVYQAVMWPPIAYGLDEYDLAGKSAAPVWYRVSWCPPGKDAASMKSNSPWSGPHWLGTDESGRDVLCRMIWGGRVSLSVGLVAVAIYVSIGIVVGALAGYFRGWSDLIISRLIEVMICFPTFFLILTVVALVGPSVRNIMIIIGLTGWTGIARLVRGEFLRLVDQEFVLAGRALGYSPLRIIFRHVLPNAMAPVLVSATFGIAGAILTESALSFLGLGISKPTPSWGGLLADGRDALQHAPWLIHFPGLAIFLTITAYNLMGEALRDASDPRLRGSR